MNPIDPSAAPRVVLVTGAAGLLGAAVADSFWQAGWQVFAGWHVQPPGSRPERWTPLALDVTSTAAMDRAFDALAARAGRLDAVVNTVGMVRDAVLPRLEVEDWRAVLEVNLGGARRVLAGAVRMMWRQPREGGHLIQAGSFAGRGGGAGQSAYAAAKAGLVGLVQSLAREGAARNVRVNLVWPGVMAGPLTRPLAPEALGRLVAANLLGRLNDPAEVAAFLRHLAGMQNVSGQVFNLDSRPVPWA
ncbi:MAG: SDR family NAD(P)-dependent oxidoreductase [Verrucomicrobiota bacterium]